MKNFRLFLTFVALILFPSAAFSEEIPLDKARQIAESFFGTGHLTKSGTDLQMIWDGSRHRTRGTSDAPAFYVFDNAAGPGFVIVAGDDAAKPVLGYSFENEFVVENMPPNVKSWMDGLEDAVSLARSNPSAYEASAVSTGNIVIKHETAKWNQSEPYNNLCPFDGTSRSVTGCVATAMAIVMRYHRWPESGTGTIPEYITSSKNITVPAIELGYAYDWDNMPLTYDDYTEAQADAVARLMADCGAMIMMNYTAEASGAATENIPYALKTYMHYDGSIGTYHRGFYDDAPWHALIQNEIATNGPVMYSGNDGSVGHAFVLDGYTDKSYYSVNWGWGSYCDGYYTLDALSPTGQGIGGSEGGYNLGQTAILNVKKDEGGKSEIRGYIHTYEGVSGLQTDTEVFEKGVPFRLSTGLLTNAGNEMFTGPMGFIIVDVNQQVKEILYSFNAELPAGYGYRFTDLELTFYSDLDFGYQLIAAMYDEGKGKWVKFIADRASGAPDAIPLYDAFSIEKSTVVNYNTETKVITLTVKDGVSLEVLTDAGSVVDGVVQSEGNVMTVAAASLSSGRYRFVLRKNDEVKELVFVVGSGE